jgi:GT2 family glycosyltransferase/glycosyltransferase involved in cell wall biosynthesis
MKLGRFIGDATARLPVIGGIARRLQGLLRRSRKASAQGKAPVSIAVADYLPSTRPAWRPPRALRVAVVIPVYRGLDETRRCLETVIAHRGTLAVEIIVVDDRSPEPELSRWLRARAASGSITLLRNDVNRGFVASVNRGMAAAGDRDVILLNSDTEVPAGWIERLAGHAYSAPRIGSVTPFSNNATICSWPAVAGGPLPPGRTVVEMDAAFLAANRGRQVDLPTAVGFCMYIRRDCLERVGKFDEATFGRGYGEENDFCLRATAAGWRHLLACDTFVFHAGETSFGKDSPERTRAWKLLTTRYPHYAATVARHVEADAAAAARFAATAALFRQAAEPTILVVTHALGGGTDRHIRDVQAAAGRRATFLRLEPRNDGLALTVPGLAGHPEALFRGHQLDGLVALLESCGVDRVHVHHWLGYETPLRRLLDRLALPFDVTIHDFFSICPQINLVPTPTSRYCGEPDAATCNACIAGRPRHGATNITDWRTRHAWMLQEAERVICPSVDARDRIARYVPHARLLAVPHEPVAERAWSVCGTSPTPGQPLRIGVLGVVAPHKGLDALATMIEAADPREFEFVVVGSCAPKLPRHLRHRVHETGPYSEADLAGLIAAARLHVVWFPATWPETYSYTLSAALAASLPIVAPPLGAFPERLADRPLTWLVEPTRDGPTLLATFSAVRAALASHHAPAAAPRVANPIPFYPDAYLAPLQPRHAPSRTGPASLRRPGLTSILVLPDRHPEGGITPCGHIRLVQPFDAMATMHPDAVVQVVDLDAALRREADAIVCQRHVVTDLAAAERLIDHCRRRGMKLIYDLDDDLVSIPATHPEAGRLTALADIVTRFVKAADGVWAATPELARRLGAVRADVELVRNAHDDRIWRYTVRRPAASRQRLVRIVYMGTATHDEELEFLRPIAESLLGRFGRDVRFDVVGVANRAHLSRCFNRVVPESGAVTQTYPGFVEWFCRQEWDIAISPLVDGPFNRCKSAIKLLDYAALGLPVVASRHVEYEAAFGGDHGVQLVSNTAGEWIDALAGMIADAEARHREGDRILEHYRRHHVLGLHPDLVWGPLRRALTGALSQRAA